MELISTTRGSKYLNLTKIIVKTFDLYANVRTFAILIKKAIAL